MAQKSMGLGFNFCFVSCHLALAKTSLVAQMVKCLSAMWETWVRSLGLEDPLEKDMATQYSCLENSMNGGAW